MDRRKFSSGRQSLLTSHSNQKTPTRQRFSALQTPGTTRKDARFSLGNAPAARRMSVFKQPTVAPRVDTSDKKLQQEMVNKIYEFIIELDGEDAATPQQIAKPTQKDFIGFLEMIYECVSPDYEVGDKKIAEEIPRLFCSVGYPYPIKPSYLQPVGASHNWHYLLHALCWLIDFVKLTQKLEDVVGSQILLSGDNSNGNIGAFRYSWLQDHFKTYVRNKQLGYQEADIEEEQQSLRDWFENQEDIGGQLRAAEAALQAIRKENYELENEKGNEEKYKDDIKKLDDDIRKGKAYCEAIEQAAGNVEKEKDNNAFETMELRSDIEGLRDILQEKKNLMNEQERGAFGIKGAEARAIMTEYDQNRVLLRELQNELENLGRERWNIQPKESQSLAHLLSRYAEIRGSISSIRKEMFEESTHEEPSPKDIRSIQHLLDNDIRRMIVNTLSDIETRIVELSKDIQTLQQKKNSIEIRAQVENEKLVDCKRNLQRKQINYQRQTEDRCKERQIILCKIESCENEKESLETDYRDIGKLEQDLESARRDLDDLQDKLSKEKLSFEEFVIAQLSGPAEVLDEIRYNVEDSEKVMADFVHCYHRVGKELNLRS